MNQSVQGNLPRSGIICDFLVDVENSGFSYGMINSVTGEKTILIEDSYTADIRVGEDAIKSSSFTTSNLVDKNNLPPYNDIF